MGFHPYMQKLIISEPYEFFPPLLNPFWHALILRGMPARMRKEYGVAAVELHGEEHLRASYEAGHGVMLCPNHCRPSDPFLFSAVSARLARPVHIMAGWHIFKQGRIQRFLLQRVGVFSMHREMTDWHSLRCAEDILCAARDPLLLFPEGITSRTNDHLFSFMRGAAHLARRAARRRSRRGGRVVIHPVGIRYFCDGDPVVAARTKLDEVEALAGLPSPPEWPLLDRIRHTGAALLARKEVEYCGSARTGSLSSRLVFLQEHVLAPLEAEWVRRPRGGPVMARGKAVRTAILPGLVDPRTPSAERERRWRHLTDLSLVQQLHCYPASYLNSGEPERLLEIVEHFEEDLTDRVRPQHPLRAVLVIGEAIEIPPLLAPEPRRDPLMEILRGRIEALLASSLQYRRTL